LNGAAEADRLESRGRPADQAQKEWQKLPKQDKAARDSLRETKLPTDLDWIDGAFVQEYDEMGLPGSTETAQVHPFKFTSAIADLARRGGATIKTGTKVTRIVQINSAVSSIEYVDRETNEEHTIFGVTDVVAAAGPWTGRLLPRSHIEGLRQHSVVFEATVSPYAVFTDIALPADWAPAHRVARGEKRKHKGHVDPELYSRPSNEVYMCGETDATVPLPDLADGVQTDELQCDDMIAYISTVSPVLRNAPIAAKQACYLPRHMRFGKEASPLIGPTTVTGLWVAAGHSCWGIQNGPATGKLMSEFVLEGEARSANVEAVNPRKFKV
jgi:glycine/D-amino acid oxidase-like deaminating enzyme